jgi:predicted Rossmann fold flavoprotein
MHLKTISPDNMHIVVIGGGAAGFFAAVTAKAANPEAQVILLERTGSLLSKVRISGGGRCNVTHSCFEPLLLSQNYPRGNKALIGPFTRFQPHDTIQWFQSRGVEIKTESDGRMFPISDNSQTIIDCLLTEAGKLGVAIKTKQHLESIQKTDHNFLLTLADGKTLECNRIILATGSNPHGHALAKSFGHTVQDPVPSLFTFNVPNSPLNDLSGISVEKATLQILDSSFSQTGPLLITHWGFSGPAALKLSAWGARFLHAKNYRVQLRINWLPDYSREEVLECLYQLRKNSPALILAASNPFSLPKNLWRRLLELCNIDSKKRFSEAGNDVMMTLSMRLIGDIYNVEGKTTHKEEFVTCGGVNLNEVDFKTMESRLCKGLFFAGEVLDIDAITGGFNFQNAWTTGWLAGNAAASN